MPDYPLRIIMDLRHNHPLDSAAILRKRDVSPIVADKFLNLFSAGHSPVVALRLHKFDLFIEYGASKYEVYAKDRHHCPDLSWCYRSVLYTLFLCSHSLHNCYNLCWSVLPDIQIRASAVFY